MADNMGLDQNPPVPMDNVEIAFKYVGDYIDANNVDGTDEYQLLLVSYSYIFGSWKALVISTLRDGRMYEVTFPAERGDLYINVYEKVGVATHLNVTAT